MRRRRNHEYKLVRRPARKEDYLAAIQYEIHLDMLRKHRKQVVLSHAQHGVFMLDTVAYNIWLAMTREPVPAFKNNPS